jgi:hypothetical protein
MRVHDNFYPGRSADGMSIDSQGNLYASAGMNQLRGTSETLDTKAGVHGSSPQGRLVKHLSGSRRLHYEQRVRRAGHENALRHRWERLVQTSNRHRRFAALRTARSRRAARRALEALQDSPVRQFRQQPLDRLVETQLAVFHQSARRVPPANDSRRQRSDPPANDSRRQRSDRLAARTRRDQDAADARGDASWSRGRSGRSPNR